VGSTYPAQAATTVLELLRDLALTATRWLRRHLQPLLVTASPPAFPEADATPWTPPGSDHAAGRSEPHPGNAAGSELPRAYGQTRAVLMARDPWSLFAHWEVSPVRRVEALRALGAEGEDAREVLRVFEVDSVSAAVSDVDLAPGVAHAHVSVERPARQYRVEVGLRTPAGRFVALATSNVVATPPAQPSGDTSVQWVALGHGDRGREVGSGWSGDRVPVTSTATALEPAVDTPANDRAEPSATGACASDALPLH